MPLTEGGGVHTKRAVLTTLVLVLLGGLVTSVALTGVDARHPSRPDWLVTVDAYRASAGLPGVSEVTAWSEQALAHARYQVANGEVGPMERAGALYASDGGAEVAANADLAGVDRGDLSERQAIDLWMSTPFHALGILRPDLKRAGFGQWSEPGRGPVQSSAVLDVVRGLDPHRDDIRRPVMWPGPGSVVPLTTYGGPELPDPLSACPDYHAPTGLGVIALLPEDEQAVGATVEVDGEVVPSCLVSETGYTNPDPATQSLGRSLLAADHAVVIIPREPLPDVADVSVSLQTGTTSLAWTFRTGATTMAILPAQPLA
jgi:hypothetical protein